MQFYADHPASGRRATLLIPTLLVGAFCLALLLLAWPVGALAQGLPPQLPARYYGAVQPNSAQGFNPSVGVTVTAWINGTECGATQTIQNGSDVVYNLPVVAASGSGGIPGCGSDGQPISFTVGSFVMLPTASWQSGIVQELTLIYAALDFGDLPANYGLSLLAVDGARHVLGTLHLGQTIDGEANGLEDALALGDDANGSNDDDGVFPSSGVLWTVGATGGSLDVIVTGGSGFLSGWIDWNNDADFNDSGEQILLDRAVISGTQRLTFAVPSGTGLNTSYYARLRLYPNSTGGTAAPTGLATDGEVEDYRWTFPLTILDEANTSITYETWRGISDPSASGGSYRVSATRNKQIYLRTLAPVTSLTVLTYRGPDQGKVRIQIDGKKVISDVDLYSPVAAWYPLTFNAQATTFTTIIALVQGTKNAASTGYDVRVDGIIEGSTTVEETNYRMRYHNWLGDADTPGSYGGLRRISTIRGTIATYQFTGTAFSLIYGVAPYNGLADVSIDGVRVATLDQYGPVKQNRIARHFGGLAPISHTVEINVLGSRSALSTGNTVNLDAVSIP